MSFVTQADQGSADIGEILVKVQDDLRHLKDQIITTAGGASVEYIDIQAIEHAIERTEQSIRDKAEQVLQATNNKVLILPSLDESASVVPSKKKQQDSSGEKQIVALKRVRSAQETRHKGLLQPLAVAREGNKPVPNAPPPGQHSKDLRNLKMLTSPGNPTTRELLSDRYGVALPYITDKKEQTDKIPGKVVTGPTVEALGTLPRANRVDPSRTPPPISEDDANKGILSLIERGLIPPAAELSLEPSPVRHRQAPLHEALEQFAKLRAPPPPDVCGVGGYNLSAVKMDPTSIQVAKESSLAERKRLRSPPANMQHLTLQQGWTQNYRMNSLPLKALEGPEQVVAPLPTPLIELRSTHKFVIQNGKTRVTSQDYLDFKQHYCLSWGSILTLILKLEELMANYCVPITFIDGDRLADLALVFELEQAPTMEHFMTCILNAEDVEKIIKTPGRRYIGPNGREMAAVKIQSTWRRYRDRTAYLQYRKQQWAAGVIAISWIMNCKLSMVRKELKVTRARQLDRFRIRAKELKANWDRVKGARRVIIHIPSLGYSPYIRENLDEINILQNLQMGRLCDITDPGVEVIYVCPVEINDEVYQYYTKLLAMKARPQSASRPGDTGDEEDIENRYKIIVPEAVHRFPTHNMCLASILKYSPKTVRRIKNLIKGRDAYIVPGVLHKDDVYVADLLDVPILSAEPEVASLYSTKSGSKRIFLSARVDVPPGAYDIYSLPQLHESLSQLVTENLHITRWVFKMDNEFDGRGTAYCDITPHLKCHSWAMKESLRYGEKWAKKWAHEPTLNKVSAEIPDILLQQAAAVNQELYPTWDKFLMDFLKRGGVIEACPPSTSITALSVDALIEPSGEINILTMADQIHASSPFRCWGYSFPQSSVDPPQLCAAADAISNACRLRGIIGYFSIDFVTFIDPNTMSQVIWAVDLKLNYSDSMTMSRLMQYVTGGNFSPQLSAFEVPVRKKREISGRRRRRRVTEEEEEPLPNPNRWAILSSRLLHSNLSVIHYSVFFQMCRAHGIGFDMKEKAGTIFTLVDSSKREHLGMFVMSDDLQGSLSTFARNLSVIHQEISAPNMQGESNFQAAIDDIDNILGTTEENKDRPPPSRSPQLHAPRPREMQRILQEHQQTMLSTADKDRKEMEEHREQQVSAATADQISTEKPMKGSLSGRAGTGQSSAPPPSPAFAGSPATSVVGIDPDPQPPGEESSPDTLNSHPPLDESSGLAEVAQKGKQQPLLPRPPPEQQISPRRRVPSSRIRTEDAGEGKDSNASPEDKLADVEPNEIILQGEKQQTLQESEERMEGKSASDGGRDISPEKLLTLQGKKEPKQPDNEQEPVSQIPDSCATVTKT